MTCPDRELRRVRYATYLALHDAARTCFDDLVELTGDQDLRVVSACLLEYLDRAFYQSPAP